MAIDRSYLIRYQGGECSTIEEQRCISLGGESLPLLATVTDRRGKRWSDLSVRSEWKRGWLKISDNSSI